MSAELHMGSSVWDIISGVHPQLRSLIDALRKNTIPEVTCLAEIQSILNNYILKLEQGEALARKFGCFSFYDAALLGTSDNVILDELSRKPGAFQTLYSAAMKKLVFAGADGIPQDTIEWLVHTNYLAPVSCSFRNCGELYSITSKGYSCLAKQKIRVRFCEDHSTNTVPKALRIPPGDWDILTLFQASMINSYFFQLGIKDYMVFPVLNRKNILLGCEIAPDPDIRYVCAWVDHPTVLADWKSCIQEMICTQNISRITVVCPRKEEVDALQDVVMSLENSGKIQISCFEVSE